MTEEKTKKISFRQKNPIECPVCSNEFYREEMLTGGGRLIAGNLSDELRRNYEKNKKYGKVYPLVYILTVCPNCLYTSYPKDFFELSPDEISKIKNSTTSRDNILKKYFGKLDFNADRNLLLGAASYMLAVDVYNMRDKKVAPTFKKGVSSIRAAWLFKDLSEFFPDKSFKKISNFFYTKTYDFYGQILELFQNGKEPIDAAGNLGPDCDKNWGYDGVLYLYSVLTLKIGGKNPDINKRIENFETTKRFLSRVFGIGKSSKSKPGALLDMTRDLYDKINEKLQSWYEEKGDLSLEE